MEEVAFSPRVLIDFAHLKLDTYNSVELLFYLYYTILSIDIEAGVRLSGAVSCSRLSAGELSAVSHAALTHLAGVSHPSYSS